jgi:hypothetical protein
MLNLHKTVSNRAKILKNHKKAIKELLKSYIAVNKSKSKWTPKQKGKFSRNGGKSLLKAEKISKALHVMKSEDFTI